MTIWEKLEGRRIPRLLSVTTEEEESDTGGGTAVDEDDEAIAPTTPTELEEDDDTTEDESATGEDEEGDEAAREAVSAEDREAQVLLQRARDTKADRDRLARENKELEERLKALESDKAYRAQLEQQAVGDRDAAKSIAKDLRLKIEQIPGEANDPERAERVYEELVLQILKAKREAMAGAVREVDQRQTQLTEQERAQQEAIAEAEGSARIALDELGLDPEKYYPAFQKEATAQMQKEPKWFKVIPPEEQFVRLARRVLQRKEAIDKANHSHRLNAGGLSEGSRKPKTPVKATRESERDEQDTLRGALGVLGKTRLATAGKLYKLSRAAG